MAAALLARALGVEPRGTASRPRRLPRPAAPHGEGGRARRRHLLRRLEGHQHRRHSPLARRASPDGSVHLILGGSHKGEDLLRARAGGAEQGEARVYLIGESAASDIEAVLGAAVPGRAQRHAGAAVGAAARYARPGRPWSCRRPAPASTSSATSSTGANVPGLVRDILGRRDRWPRSSPSTACCSPSWCCSCLRIGDGLLGLGAAGRGRGLALELRSWSSRERRRSASWRWRW
jgi:hypothetical protein